MCMGKTQEKPSKVGLRESQGNAADRTIIDPVKRRKEKERAKERAEGYKRMKELNKG
jgi:hypothetical protein